MKRMLTNDPAAVRLMMSVSADELGPYVVTLELTRPLIEELLRRADLHRAHKRLDPNLYNHTYLDPVMEVFQADVEKDIPAEDAAKIKDIFEDDSRYPTDGLREVAPGELPENGNARVECDELIVTGSMTGERPDMVDFRWEAYIKHTDLTIRTCDLTEEVVRALLARLS